MLYITLAVSAASYAFVYSALVALAPGLALLRARPWAHVQTIASMAATLAIARSPASMVSLAEPACFVALLAHPFEAVSVGPVSLNMHQLPCHVPDHAEDPLSVTAELLHAHAAHVFGKRSIA